MLLNSSPLFIVRNCLMYKLIRVLLLFFALSPFLNAAEETVELEKGFEWIFDGKTFHGWEGNLNWFRIEDGAIIAGLSLIHI